jgi:hypothetical protein
MPDVCFSPRSCGIADIPLPLDMLSAKEDIERQANCAAVKDQITI